MGLKRYIANSDTTITDAYEANLQTRGTGSNMGASDIIEIFSIFGQASTSSYEKSRILVKFPIEEARADRVSGEIPDSGSVQFYLNLYNAPHGETLPRNFSLEVLPISTR